MKNFIAHLMRLFEDRKASIKASEMVDPSEEKMTSGFHGTWGLYSG